MVHSHNSLKVCDVGIRITCTVHVGINSTLLALFFLQKHDFYEKGQNLDPRSMDHLRHLFGPRPWTAYSLSVKKKEGTPRIHVLHRCCFSTVSAILSCGHVSDFFLAQVT